MPERHALVRRVVYLTAVATLLATFAFSLTGIAGTQGQIRSDGEAVSLARELLREHDCPAPAPPV